MGPLNHNYKLEEMQKVFDVPKWYIGVSDYQEKAMKELTNDLRDDFEQGTSFRVEKDLMRLGLDPIISKKKIRTMVQLSRGNDLAFLFFILEGYYKSCQINGEYTTNEKLLMIAIAKIDLLPTLRELDRILPPAQLSTLELKRQRRTLYQPKTIRTQQEVAPHKATKSNKSPYFQRQPRPKEIPVKYTSKPPNHIVNFPFWPLDETPQYGRPTEGPWFMDFQLNPVGRLVKSTVSEAVDKYFNHLNLMRALETKARFSRRAQTALERERTYLNDEPHLCAYHQFMIGERQAVKDELVVKARDHCMKLMDLSLPYRKLRQRRILEELERDVDDCLKRYALKMDHVSVTAISNVDCVLCQEKMVSLPAPKPQDKQGRALVGDCLNLAHTDILSNYVGKRLTGGGIRRESVDFDGELDECFMPPEISKLIPDSDKACYITNSKNQQRISFLLDDRKLKQLRKKRKEQSVEVRYEGKQTKKTFFKAPTAHQPYQFKYKRIFKSGQEKPRDVKRVIAKAIVNALRVDDTPLPPHCVKSNDDTSEVDIDKLEMQVSGFRLTDSCASTDDSEQSLRSHEDRRADIVDAVVRCAKEVWMKGVNMKRAEMEEAEKSKKPQVKQTSVLNYDNNVIDPDDADLMDRLIQDGLRELRKNQRYVLASLPNAHKLPVLQEWVKRRYGKQYTEREMQKNIQQSEKVFELVTLLQGNPPPANLMGMDAIPKSKENYAFCQEARALGNKVRHTYYKKLNDIYMRHTRACWYAMGNYLVPGGPPREVFFAYMSASTRDIMRNRVWNGEYRNIRRLRDMFNEKHKSA